MIHDNRWMAIIGIPLGIIGVVIAIGPWFLDGVNNSDAWPILAGGSLIGLGFIVAGLFLCFKYEEFIADQNSGMLTRNYGLEPFRRTTEWRLSEFAEVACVDITMSRSSGPGASLHHRLKLIGSSSSVTLASDLETKPILAEAERWAEFLELPLQNRMGQSKETRLKETLAEFKG